MTYQQLNLNYIQAFASYTPNWAGACGLGCNPCDGCPTLGTCAGPCSPCNTGAFRACNGAIWMNPSTPIVDASAIPVPPPEPCPIKCCKKKRSCKKDKCGKKRCCDEKTCCTPPICPIKIDYCGPCGTPLCIEPCPPPCIPLVPMVQLDPCLNPWVKNLPWLQRTYAGRYDILPRV